ncbi:MAG TPA: hypothetical protein VFE65_26730 [Pseudonocardia sp.]|jgi:hypothetical protein|nr:hypothetical protein [Pseudonocardia sp.]
MTSAERPQIYLHVGAAKTGTSYLQAVLWENRDELRRRGLLYPGLSSDAHFRAATDLQGQNFQEHIDPIAVGAWSRLVAQARSWGGSVVLSHELFGTANEAAIERALTDLSFGDVHLLYTARDLARQIPAAWQEDVKNRQLLTFTDFLAELREHSPNHFLAKLFWQLQDAPGVLAMWAGCARFPVPPERVHVITLPPRGAAPGELWRRFSTALGLSPDGFDTEVGAKANRSMGAAETQLVRRLNAQLGDRLDWPSYDILVKDYLGAQVLGARAGSRPLRLPRSEHEWVTERAISIVERLHSPRYHIVGDLAELVPAADDSTDGETRMSAQPIGVHGSGTAVLSRAPEEEHPDAVADAEVLDAAVFALAEMVRFSIEQARPVQPSWRRTALALSERHRAIRRLHHRYLSVKARYFR